MAKKNAASLKISGLVELAPAALLETNGGRGPTSGAPLQSAPPVSLWSYLTRPHRIGR